MKKIVLIILIAFGFVSISAQTDGGKAIQTAALEEAQKTSLEAVKLFREKKFDEALPLAQRVIAIRENAQGKNHAQVAGAWRIWVIFSCSAVSAKKQKTLFAKR